MNNTRSLSISLSDHAFIILILCAQLCAQPVSVVAQAVEANHLQIPSQELSGKRISADENFDLKIDERRITRQNFTASTSVGTVADPALNLEIGVALAAGRIDVLLRNVRGRVRFRGSLERILATINNRRTTIPGPSTKQ